MKRRIIIFFYCLIVQTINAQIISKKDFINTEWFSHNADSAFFNSDTIRLVKYSNVYERGKGYIIYYESEAFNDSQSVKFRFKRQGNLNFWEINYHQSSKAIVGERNWKIKKQNSVLILFKNGVIESTFIPVKWNQIEFEVDDKKYFTKELVVIKFDNH